MSRHTPGPWHVAPCEAHKDDPPGAFICDQVRTADGKPLRPTVVDRLLQAAAPELLAALEGALPHLASLNWANKRNNPLLVAKKAIAKARGEEP